MALLFQQVPVVDLDGAYRTAANRDPRFAVEHEPGFALSSDWLMALAVRYGLARNPDIGHRDWDAFNSQMPCISQMGSFVSGYGISTCEVPADELANSVATPSCCPGHEPRYAVGALRIAAEGVGSYDRDRPGGSRWWLQTDIAICTWARTGTKLLAPLATTLVGADVNERRVVRVGGHLIGTAIMSGVQDLLAHDRLAQLMGDAPQAPRDVDDWLAAECSWEDD